jgi:hypothetical protein
VKRAPRKLPAAVALSAILLLTLCGCGGGSSPQSVAIAFPSAAPGIAASIEVGAWVKPPDLSGTAAQNIAVLESEIGRRLDISLHYDPFAATFPSTDELADKVAGRIPEVSWDCGGTDADVAAGRYDATIAAEARNMAAFGSQILLRYKWEFNLPTSSNNRSECIDPATDADGYFSAAEFVAAWRHIHDIFRAANATNVLFLWNPDAGSGSPSALPYWPGDAYVDWIGIDAYDGAGRGLVATLGPGYAAYASLGTGTHPFAVGETGTTAPYQTAYLNGNSRAILAAHFPTLQALSYFDAAGPIENWSFTPAGLASFKAFVDR